MNIVQIFPEQYTRFPGRRQRWYVRLVSSNGRTLSVSEAYFSKWNAKRAARKNFPGLTIREMDS